MVGERWCCALKIAGSEGKLSAWDSGLTTGNIGNFL